MKYNRLEIALTARNVYPESVNYDLCIGSHHELINKPESNIELQGQIQEFWKGGI